MTARLARAMSLSRVAKIVVILAIFSFVFVALWRNLDELRAADISLNLSLLAASFPFAVAYLVGRSMIWHLVIAHVVRSLPLHLDMLSWLGSIVGKYIPGKVFLLLGRVHLYRGSGATAGAVSLAFLLETCCACLAALMIFGATFATRGTAALEAYAGSAGVAMIVIVVVTHPRILGGVLNAGLRLAKRPPVALQLRWSRIWLWTFLMAANWLVLGTGFYLLLRSLIDLPLSCLLYVTGCFALAGVIGLLVLFAPSGIGVREGVMTATLATILPTGVAVVAALVARVWMTLAEVFCAATALFVSRLLRARGKLAPLGTEQEGEDSIDASV